MPKCCEGIPGSYGRVYPWPSGMEEDPGINLAAREFYRLYKDLYRANAGFAERKKKVDEFFETHKDNGVGEWLEGCDLQWDKMRRARMLAAKAHQDLQQEGGKRRPKSF